MSNKRRNTITISENNKRKTHPARHPLTSPLPDHHKNLGTEDANPSCFADLLSPKSPKLSLYWNAEKGEIGENHTIYEQSNHLGHTQPASKKSEAPMGPAKILPGVEFLDDTQTENTDLLPSAFEKDVRHQDTQIDGNQVCSLPLLLPTDTDCQDNHASGISVKRHPREQNVKMCVQNIEREDKEEATFTRTKSLDGSTVHSARKSESLYSANFSELRDFEVELGTILDGLVSCQESLDLVLKTFARRSTVLWQYIEELKKNLVILDTERSQNLMSISHFRRQVEMTQKELSEKSLLASKLDTETKNLRQAVHMSEVKVQSLESTASDAREQTDKLRVAYASLEKTNKLLKEEICLLQESHHNITATNQALGQKISMLNSTTQALHEEMDASKRGRKAMQVEIARKGDSILQLENVQRKLEEQNQFLEEQSQESRDYLKRLEADNRCLNDLLAIVQRDLAEIQAQSADKDRIISDDSQLVSDIHRELSKQKLIIDDMRKEGEKNAAGHELSESELMMQVSSLKSQILAAQQKSDERIQEMAEQLYHQYSKKHEVKVSQLRRHHDSKIGESLAETKEFQKKVEHLESQLKMELREKKYLLSVLDKEKVHVV